MENSLGLKNITFNLNNSEQLHNFASTVQNFKTQSEISYAFLLHILYKFKVLTILYKQMVFNLLYTQFLFEGGCL